MFVVALSLFLFHVLQLRINLCCLPFSYISVFLNQSWFPSIKCLLSTDADKEAVQNPDVYLSHVRRFYKVMHFILQVVQLNCTMEK